MDTELKNTVLSTGTYDGQTAILTSAELITTIVDGLTITVAADKEVWVDNSKLTYTITINNQANQTYVAPVVSDTLDISIIDFVADSVYINGTKATSDKYTYDSQTGKLDITLSDIAVSSQSVVTFQVEKKTI